MSKESRDEKYEKEEKQREQDEKEVRKQEEKWQRDRLASLVWALILIWAGVVFLIGNVGTFDFITDLIEGLPFRTEDLPFDIVPIEAWTIFFVGAAFILIIEIIVRLTMPQYNRPVLGTIILAVVFLALGLGTWACVLPMVLILVGASILWRSFSNKE